MKPFITLELPKIAGYYQIGSGSMGFRIHLSQRPRWLTRALMALLLEWRWHDECSSRK